MRLFNPLPSITVVYEGPTWYRSPQSHKHHSCHRVLQAHGAAKVGCQVTNDGGEHSDHADGHHEACPAVPVISGRYEGEQKLPEDGQEVHDVVETRRELLLAALVLIVVAWKQRNVYRSIEWMSSNLHDFMVKIETPILLLWFKMLNVERSCE